MPHGAPALHTWKVDMMGESLPGGEKKKERKKAKYNVDIQLHTYMHSLQSHRCMMGWMFSFLSDRTTKRKTTVPGQILCVDKCGTAVEKKKVFRFIMHITEHYHRLLNHTETMLQMLSRPVV